jgi:hypothetical protein
VSALGGFVAIFAVYWTSHLVLGPTASPILVLSMGSTAAMLFAVPHGALSQPWPLLGGHLVSGLIGIACLLWIPDPMLAAAVATGLALGAMHYLRCIHPPAGATALAAALGNETVKAMGFAFVIAPLMLNVLIILASPSPSTPVSLAPLSGRTGAPQSEPGSGRRRLRRDIARRLRLCPVAAGFLHRCLGGRPAAHLRPGHRAPPRPAGAGRGAGNQPFCAFLKAAKSPPFR